MTTATFTRTLPPVLADLRSSMVADGWSATSPLTLGSEGERTARSERADYDKEG